MNARTLPLLAYQQHRIMRLVAAGHSNSEIAATLGISQHTVQSQLRAIFGKLGARDRAHAVCLCYERRIFTVRGEGTTNV